MSLAFCASLAAAPPPAYPATPKGPVVEDHFGTSVPDPYRWLEDDNAPDTKAWVEAQNKVTNAYLEEIPGRRAIGERLTRLWNFERYGIPSRHGKTYAYFHNSGLQNQSVLFVTEDLKKKGRVLLDPNHMDSEGTTALGNLSFSEDGRHLAYSISKAGSDWQTWKVRDVATGRDLPDEIRWSKFSGAAWRKDGLGFFYSAYEAPKDGEALTGINKFQKVFFHKLGTPQSQDQVVFERKDQPDWGFSAEVTEDGRFLVITQTEGTENRNRLFLLDLTQPRAAVEPFLDAYDASYRVVGNNQDTFYLQTTKDAPRQRLMAVRRGATLPKDWVEVLPQAKGTEVLSSVSLVGGRFLAEWMRDAHSVVTFHDLKGRPTGKLTLPTLGSVSGLSGKLKDKETFYRFTSFTYPGAVYRLDLKTGKSTLWRASKVDFKPEAFEVKQVFYPSKDGTKVPLFLVHRKGLQLDGQNPTLLYGYGGFNVPLTPSFNVTSLVWLEMGGVYAMANLRGGGEYGDAWYHAGRLDKKQNVFDDFIAAGEWLIAQKYTSTPKLAIHGGSNGGLLVGACLVQRPDLWGAAVPQVGVLDMLRYHKFTIGWAWKSDYPVSDTQEGFNALMTWSPLHNVKTGTHYPPTLVMTGDHDDRVVPAHSHKFTATLQAAQGGAAPILTRITTNAGHGAGMPTSKIIEEKRDFLAFLVRALGVKAMKPETGK